MNEIETKTLKNTKKEMSWLTFFVFLVLIVLFRIFILEPHSVSGSSMDNTFKNGDYVLVDKISYKFITPKKGDVIVFNPPKDVNNKNRFIKRIIATPGDNIYVNENGTYINNDLINEDFVTFKSNKASENILLKTDEYFVMGDNRTVSYDSRYWGPINKDEIQGRVLIRLYPFNKISIFPGLKEYNK